MDDTLSIAAFVMFSDVEMTVECAKALLQKVPEFDLILTAESKVSRWRTKWQSKAGKNYVLARKMSKLYMKNPMEIFCKIITTARVQTLFLDQHEADMMKGKRPADCGRRGQHRRLFGCAGRTGKQDRRQYCR